MNDKMNDKMNYDYTAIMREAWRLIRQNGYTRSEALKTAWLLAKVQRRMRAGVAAFAYLKVDGTVREAHGTLAESALPPTGGNRRENPTLLTYYDTDKMAWRSFKRANILTIDI